jgi:hypothetical protein
MNANAGLKPILSTSGFCLKMGTGTTGLWEKPKTISSMKTTGKIAKLFY